jgi:hypothetical protein
MRSDLLLTTEVQRTKRAIADLSEVSWAQPLLSRLDKAGGIKPENMPLMFEVRFAQELHHTGITAEYEYHAGVGNSTIEFRLNTTPIWLIELLSVRTSDAAKRAIRKVGLIYEQLIRPTPEDPGRSEEGEMITAEQKIGEKVFARGNPTKFPPLDDTLRLILADIRGYLIQGGDVLDYRQMAYGAKGLPPEYSWAVHCWENQTDRLAPIKGLFEQDNPLRAAQYIQERIHFLGFVRERDFYDGEIKDVCYYLANWHLFLTKEEAKSAYETFPLAQMASK